VNFASIAFVVLFALVFLARLTIGRRRTEPAFIAVLVVASTVFYAWHVPTYLALLLLSAGVDYIAARRIADAAPDATRYRRLLLIVSLSANLGLLGFFKYFEFLLRSAVDVLSWFGPVAAPPDLGIVLPMGISFYTFQSMSYTIDVYRGVLQPYRSFAPFYLFISFFPQLVAGPIVRATEWVPQAAKPRRLRLVSFYEGAWLMVLGFFFKLVVADNLGAIVNTQWAAAAVPGGAAWPALLVALLFSGQIFADFAGYSGIAIGLGYLLGFRFPENFRAPYIAASFREFWTRWHITLSRWLRDYLYIPLGGNRKGRARTEINLLLVMLLGGLWHGAAYRFIIWGAIHGVALAVERQLGMDGASRRRGALATVGWFLVVQAVVLVGWVFFRSQTHGEALGLLGNIVSLRGGDAPPWGFAGVMFLMPLVVHHVWWWVTEHRLARPLGARGRTILAALMLMAMATISGSAGDFLYFQF